MSDLAVVAHGVRVTLTLSDGADGAPVIFIDTDESVPEGNRGPKIRVHVNEGEVFVGTPYVPREEDDTT